VDLLGHLGGFLTGLVVGHWVMPCYETAIAKKERAKRAGWISGIVTGVWLVAMLTFFFTLRTPAE